MTPSDDNTNLTIRLKHGDHGALREFYDTFFDPVYHFVYYRSGCRLDFAEDIVSDVFLAAIGSFGSLLGDDTTLQKWLFGIARHKLADHMQQQAKDYQLARALVRSDAKVLEMLRMLEGKQADDSLLEDEDIKNLVGATLTSLPVSYQDALKQKYISGKSVADIATLSGRTERAVEGLLRRAREAFKAAFQIIAKELAAS
ncbi:RNA polymerase sigma factor [Planctomycetota bacterium]